MRELKASHLSATGKSSQPKARDVAIEERHCDIAIKKMLVIFYMAKDIACFLCLLVMLILVLSERVNGEVFLVSQIINAIIRGRGKGLQRITESEFSVRGLKDCR